METSFTKRRDRWRAGAMLLLLILTAAYVLAAARAKTWSTSLTTTADSILIVSNLLPTSPAFAVRVLRNDVVQPAALRFANTSAYRCTACADGAAHWTVEVLGGLPETTSIAALSPPTATLPR